VKQSSLVLKDVGSDIAISFAGSILLAFISQYYIPLPFTPIPISLQTIGIFLIAGMLDPLKAFLSVFFYLLEGTLGFPVFAGGLSKPLWFNASTAGFLFSFLFTVPLISKVLQYRKGKHWLFIFSTLCIAQTVIFIFGMGWLSFFIGIKKAFIQGVFPFIIGAFVKIGVATFLLKTIFFKRSD
jgi:biotin transport system substrate-specific component